MCEAAAPGMVSRLVRGGFLRLSGVGLGVLGCLRGGENSVLAGVGMQEDGGVCFIFTGAPMYGGVHEKQ